MGYRKSQSRYVIDDIFEIISDAIIKRERVVIRGFGAFEVKMHKGRMGTDPKTLLPMPYDDYPVITFTPGDLLKESVKTGKKVEHMYCKESEPGSEK